jgi:hypothetical protein
VCARCLSFAGFDLTWPDRSLAPAACPRSEFNQAYTAKSSFDDNLMFLRSVLLGLHKSLKSVVFVLDGFERFARMRGKQQLLYNLFDVLQHSKVQVSTAVQLQHQQAILQLVHCRCHPRMLPGCECAPEQP